MIDLSNLKIRILYRWILHKDAVYRFIYCKRNWHRLRSNKWIRHNANGEVLEVSYLECVYCQTCFFQNEEDKEVYIRLKYAERSNWQRTMGYLKRPVPKKFRRKINIKEFDS